MKCSAKAFLLIASLVAVIVMMMMDSTSAQKTTTTTTTKPISEIPKVEEKIVMDEKMYNKTVQILDELVKKLRNQRINAKKEVIDASAELENAKQEELLARQKVDALRKKFFEAKKLRETYGVKVEESIKTLEKAQTRAKKALSDYNRMARGNANNDDEKQLETERSRLKSINEKIEKLSNVRKSK